MDFISKIEQVKERIGFSQKALGDKFPYLVSNFATEDDEGGEPDIYIDGGEHRRILDYLATKGYLEVSERKGGAVQIKILPKAEPVIKLKTLEHIARDLQDYFTGKDIVALLKEAGVDQELIVYPQSKWLIFYAVFKELALSKDTKDGDLLFKILGDAIHPLNWGGDFSAEKSEWLQEKFNKYLEYDGLALFYSDAEKKYEVLRKLHAEEEEDVIGGDLFVQEQEELAFLRLPENKEKISTLRKAYQVFMNIAEVFCDNPSKPSNLMNHSYVITKKLITDAARDLHLYVSSASGVQRIHTLAHYCIPFNNLFTAEAEYKDRASEKLHWDEIRPKMNATYGCIDELYRKVDGSDILSKPDVQQTLNEISLLLSKTKEENRKRAEAKQRASVPQIPVQKIEITAMPELQIRNTEDNTITKGKKRIYPPKFEPTDWAKITLRFIDEQNVFIAADKKQVPSDYEALGFADDKRGKPNTAWAFLLGLARNNGETQTLASPIPDTIKQQKRQLSDRLKTIFKNDTDPFYDPTKTHIYKIKINLLPPQSENERPDKFGVQEFLDETMTSVYEDAKEQ